jgi:hypothetical protein
MKTRWTSLIDDGSLVVLRVHWPTCFFRIVRISDWGDTDLNQPVLHRMG